MISYGRQSIGNDEIDAVVKVLKSDFLTQGPEVSLFEKEIAEYCGAKYCVAVSNGTAALHLAVAALDLPEGSEGITSTNTFTASATSMVYNQVKPVFADIDSRTYNVTPKTMLPNITNKTKLLLPVHFAGQPCDMKSIRKLANDNNFYVIEDAAHAIGSSYADGDKIGSCKYSDLTTFSFHPVKTITTGEGGAITTNSEVLYKKLLLLRSHGITKDPSFLSKNPGPWYYEMQSLGFNYRMCDMQAALGRVQLKKLDNLKKSRRGIVNWYNEAFKDNDLLQIPYEEKIADSCFHLYVLRIKFSELKIDRKIFMAKLLEKGIGTQVHYIPVHTQPYYRALVGEKGLPESELYYEEALSLPLFPDLSKVDQNRVIKEVLDCLKLD